MPSSLFALDEAHPLTPRLRLLAAAGGAIFLLITVVMLRFARVEMPVLPWAPVTESLVVATIAGVSALLLFGQARVTQHRGYFWLAGGFMFIALTRLTATLLRPDVFTDGQVLGNDQSWPYLSFAWFWVVPILLLYSGWLFRSPAPTAVDPDVRPLRAWPRALTTAGLALGGVLAAVFLTPYLPLIVAPDGDITAFGQWLGRAWLVLVVLATIFMARWAFKLQTVIHRWMVVVLVILIGQALVNTASEPWSLGWYFNRAVTVLSTSLLLLILLLAINRVLWSTRRAAYQDPLTEIESRLSLTRALDTYISDGRGCTFLWIDVDEFKSVNDGMGHETGDAVLQAIAGRLMRTVEGRARVGRLGGDEFGVIMADGDTGAVGTDVVDAMANDLLKTVRPPIESPEATTRLTCSIGIAVAPRDAATPGRLLDRADMAMYAAKANGGDRAVWFTSDIGRAGVAGARLRHRLSEGIAEQAFDFDFQPIVTSTSHRLAGVEALCRWECDGERLAAGRFIELAERTGQIVMIGQLLLGKLESAAPQLRSALPAGGFICYNLSVQELMHAATIDRLLDGPLAAHAAQIVLEITESRALHDKRLARDSVHRLRAGGYRIGIDDFGSGYSNFRQLEELEPDVLKLDRGLIARAGRHSAGDDPFLAAAVQVARSLRCQIVAEGIETRNEEVAATMHDVDHLQGFRYGRPMPLTELMARLGDGMPTATIPAQPGSAAVADPPRG